MGDFQGPMLLRELLLQAVKYFKTQSIDSPRDQAEQVIESALNWVRRELYANLDCTVEDDQVQKCWHALIRRASGEPIAYICGHVEFLGCSLTVSPAVLIPRQETEVLADKIVSTLQRQDHAGAVLWDLCTGSGALAIAIKKKCPQLEVVASDLSEQALALAKKNALDNGVKVKFLHGDLLQPFKGKKADMVVSNPPYISQKDYESLDRQVRDFEPYQALVGGADGLDFYRRLAKELPLHLNPHGRVWLEIGYDQEEKVKELFFKGPWRSCVIEKDWAGHPRFFSLEKE